VPTCTGCGVEVEDELRLRRGECSDCRVYAMEPLHLEDYVQPMAAPEEDDTPVWTHACVSCGERFSASISADGRMRSACMACWDTEEPSLRTLQVGSQSVDGCQSCPFCSIQRCTRLAERPVPQSGTPDWCPLRNAPVLVQLSDEAMFDEPREEPPPTSLWDKLNDS